MSERDGNDRGDKGVTIHINKDRFVVQNPVSGAELRNLGNIPTGNQLFLEAPGDDPDVLIIDGQSYTLKNGAHLYDLPKGTVGGADIATQLDFVRSHLDGSTVAALADGSTMIRWTASPGPDWGAGRRELFIVAPPLYPAQAPSGFDAVGQLLFRGAQPPGSGPREFEGLSATHFCWNASGEIDYTDEDGLWRFAKFSETRFIHES
jgi:hypothetical protein